LDERLARNEMNTTTFVILAIVMGAVAVVANAGEMSLLH